GRARGDRRRPGAGVAPRARSDPRRGRAAPTRSRSDRRCGGRGRAIEGRMATTEIIRTAFDRPQRELGCEFTDWEGWYWPNHFGDPEAEHRAVREDVGIWDESPLRKWHFRGREALAAADRIFVNDMLGL